MRRSGSSSCLLRPRSALSLSELSESEPPTVTVFNTERLPTYSTERYYMLSELEVHSHSVQFLCDMMDDDNLCQQEDATENTTNDSSNDNNDDDKKDIKSEGRKSSPPPILLPPCVLLYILWRPEEVSSPRALAEGLITDAVRRIRSLVGCSDSNDTNRNFKSSSSMPSMPPQQLSPPQSPTSSWSMSPLTRTNYRTDDDEIAIYLVVDRVSPSTIPHLDNDDSDADEEDDEHTNNQQNRHHHLETQTTEYLAKTVASNPYLRRTLQGISVGVTPNVRVAPGLETCLKCIWYGQKERREWSKTSHTKSRDHQTNQKSSLLSAAVMNVAQDISKSAVGIIAHHPDDLVGMDPERETDAVQGATQSRVTAEWNGNGNYESFAFRSMKRWRMLCVDMDIVPEECLLFANETCESLGGSDIGGGGARLARNKNGKKKRKIKRIKKDGQGRSGKKGTTHPNDGEEEEFIPRGKHAEQADITSTAMVVVFLCCVVAHVWREYKDAMICLLGGKEEKIIP